MKKLLKTLNKTYFKLGLIIIQICIQGQLLAICMLRIARWQVYSASF